MHNNLIVVPAIVTNGAYITDTLNFVVDTGVNPTIILDTTLRNQLALNDDYRNVNIQGAIKDLVVKGQAIPFLNAYIDKLAFEQQTIIFLEKDLPYISYYAGIKVHGIVGYEFFRNLVITIDYEQKLLYCYTPKKFYKRKRRLKKLSSIPITLAQNKPYVKATLYKYNEQDTLQRTVNLLVDTGAGFSLSIEKRKKVKDFIPSTYKGKKIGTTLTGEILGEVGRLPYFELGTFGWQGVITSFPDSVKDEKLYRVDLNRDGILGAGILSRFRLTFDYLNGKVWLRPNKKYKLPFQYALSGIELVAIAPSYKMYKIARVYPNSIAQQVGLEKGDELVAINNTMARKLRIGQIYNMIDKKVGQKVNLLVRRSGRLLYFSFRLQPVP
ncbi:MAG: PDZ domain-containing protein [Thermonemataceae bacterium]